MSFVLLHGTLHEVGMVVALVVVGYLKKCVRVYRFVHPCDKVDILHGDFSILCFHVLVLFDAGLCHIGFVGGWRWNGLPETAHGKHAEDDQRGEHRLGVGVWMEGEQRKDAECHDHTEQCNSLPGAFLWPVVKFIQFES